MRRLFRRSLRQRIWLTVIAAMAIVLLVLTVAFNLLVSSRLNHDADNVAAARATAELGALRVAGGRIHLGESSDAGAVDSPTWVFEGARALESPRGAEAAGAPAVSLTRRGRGFMTADGGRLRLYGLPVIAGSRRVGTVVAAVGLKPYRQIERTALVASAVLAVLALLAVAAATRWMIGRSLRPVSEMTQQAAEWSEHQLDRRFAYGEPRDEFTRLAATLDSLLDRVAASLRHEQNLTAELSHELRTPLTQISAEAQYGLRHGSADAEQRATLERILASTRQLTRVLDTLMAAARAQGGSASATTTVIQSARAAVAPFQRTADDAGVRLELRLPSEDAMLAVDAGVVERVLAPILENAIRYADSRVVVEVSLDQREATFTVDDDGSGISPADAEAVFAPGFRSAGEPVAVLSGAGLGLPLARRLARGVGGDVRVAEAPGAGATLVVTLPRA